MPRSTKTKNATIKYSVHPSISMMVKWIDDLKDKTGRNLDEWCTFIRKEGPKDLAARREWLKTKHKLGTNSCWWLAERAEGQPTWDESPEAYLGIAPMYVDDMFAGGKSALRPIGDALMRMALEVADDIKFCPCQTIIPFYRNHVIAQIKPSTRTRIDFGFSLGKDVPFTARLKDTGGIAKKNRITHHVAITKMEDIDAEVKKWLRMAYERDE